LLKQSTGTRNGGTQGGAPANVTDFNRNLWQLGGDFNATKTATTVTRLDKVYDLSKIHTWYDSYLPASYNLRTSIDGVSWSPLVTGETPVAFKVDTFATRQVKRHEGSDRKRTGKIDRWSARASKNVQEDRGLGNPLPTPWHRVSRVRRKSSEA